MSATSTLSQGRSSVLTRELTAAQAAWIIVFAAATALSARLEVPYQPVPFTLQTLMVLLSGAILGARNGAISQVLYLAAGILGAPVFAGGALGAARLFGPTGGYLLAFPAAAAVTGLLVREQSTLLRSFLAMAAGMLVIFTSGTLQLYATYLHNWSAAFSSGFLIFTWWDLLKISAAAMIYHEWAKRTKSGGS